MERSEALRILGLDEEATISDIKTAYKETVQILHPDKFASNKKLQERATEQFKAMQQAYELLMKGRAEGPFPDKKASGTQGYAAHDAARHAGLTAACSRLVAERDVLFDERRNGIILAAFGLVIGVLLRRIPLVAALGGAALVWGLTKVVFSQNSINVLNKHIAAIKKEKKDLEEAARNGT